MQFRIESAPGNLNLLQVRLNDRLTSGGTFTIFRDDPPHIVQQKMKMCAQKPEHLLTFYYESCALEGVTGQMVFFPYRIEVQVREECVRKEMVEGLEYSLQLISDDGTLEPMEGVIQADRKLRLA